MTWFRVIKNYVKLITMLQQIMQTVSRFALGKSNYCQELPLAAIVKAKIMFYPQLILGWYSVFSIEHQNYPEGIGFAFTTLLDRFLNLHHPTQPISCKTNTNQTWPCMFSRAWCQSSEFVLSTQWLIVMFSFVVVGLCDCFGWVKVVQNESAFYRDFTVIPFFSLRNKC